MADRRGAKQTGTRTGGADRRRRSATPAEPATDHGRGQRRLPVAFLRPNPRNPRKTFDAADLDELTASIREKGVVQPILVRPVAGAADSYEIIAGERRWRAAQKAGLHDVPVVVHELSDKEALELAIIENVQRAGPQRARGGDRLSAAHRRVTATARASSPT